jgi:HEAT repeat protein
MHVDQMHRLKASGMAGYTKRLRTLSLGFALIGAVANKPVIAQAPGPELFAKEPRSPLELWDAVDYLLRTNQANRALPYIDRFVKSKPDDATLIAIRNRYGPGSILRLSDNEVTRPFAQPMAEAMVAAAHKFATRPERVVQLISDLTKTPEEQDYAVRHLREAGPDAVPFLVDALSRPDLSSDDRILIVRNMGRLDHSVIPPLVAMLDCPDPSLAADAATALGMIGNKEAIPFLTFPAAFPEASPILRAAAQAAITQLTGQPFSNQRLRPTQVLINAAWRYHRHQVEFRNDPVTIWAWDNNRKAQVGRQALRSEAEGVLGLQLVQQALRLEPGNHEAQVAQVSLNLEKAIERLGFSSFVTKDAATFNAAKASEPSILSDVLKTAIRDRKAELAAIAATALGQTIDRAALAATGQPHPLVDAVYAPARHVQFAAAKALVALAPTQPFPGSSRVVPTLARFVMNQSLPRAVVIDANPTRGSQLAGLLISLGYDSELELSGVRGFRAAAESADVELILISFDLFRSGWALNDTLANLGADSRTAAIPVFVYGPLNVQYKHPNLEHDYPGIKFLVQPVSADLLFQQLKGLPALPSETMRVGYAQEAAMLLARIATERMSPFIADLPAVEPALALALNEAQTATNAAVALRNVADPDAQRSLADVVLDPSRPSAIRKQSASELVHSIQQFGRLITASQETRLATIIREETDPEVHNSLLAILRALIPVPPLGSPKPLNPIIPHESEGAGQTTPATVLKPSQTGAGQ